MDAGELVKSLAVHVRTAVQPHIGRRAAGEEVVRGQSGDFDFPIDEIAENSIVEFLDSCGVPCSTYTESRGMVQKPGAKHLLIIDPIDGTRPARVGFEQCVVSVARLHPDDPPTLGQVTHGCLAHLKSDTVVTAELGAGARENGRPLSPSANVDIAKAPMAFEIAGRPSAEVFQLLAPLVDTLSLGGGAFLFSSTAFALWQLARGSLDVFIDVAPQAYRRAGRKGFGMKPYDIAAARLIALESGACVTNSFGGPLEPVTCLKADDDHTLGVIAANRAEVHARILEIINTDGNETIQQ